MAQRLFLGCSMIRPKLAEARSRADLIDILAIAISEVKCIYGESAKTECAGGDSEEN